ncbi:MAG: hypothetical protein AB7E47_16835 [Desulfovibrionaceae bacterium]
MTKRSILAVPLLLLALTMGFAATAPCGGDTEHAPDQSLKTRLEHASQRFKHFARMWLGKLSANYRCTAERMEVEPRGDRFVARYFELDPTTLTTDVKPTAASTDTFLGKLKYVEATFESEGDSPEAATAGPFVMVKQVLHSELFCYANGDWRY